MDADMFRHLYGYHFTQNRTLWDNHIMHLTDEAFTQENAYSRGSVKNQVVHLMNAENGWFRGLQGETDAEWPAPETFPTRAAIREHWDAVETMMRGYLETLQDDMLRAKPFVIEADKDLQAWQVLLHVVNHATDHRAQLLRALNDVGQDTPSQDYIFYVYENLD